MATDSAIITSARQQTSSQFSTFFIGDLFFGVDVLHVQEVLRFQPMTAVPQAPDAVEGLINLRGQIVTAIDMRRRLHMPKLPEDRTPMNIVVRTPDGAVSLLVDEIGDVLQMDESNYERPPDNLDPSARELILGVYKMKNSLLLVLDTDRAIEVGDSLVSLNAKIDSHSTEAPPNGRRSLSPKSGELEEDRTRPVRQQQNSNGKGTRKVAARKTGDAARVSRAGPM